MKYVQHLCYTLLLPCLLFSQAVKADILEYNHAFSYFEFGAEIISYGETIQFAGSNLVMEQTVVNPMQRSGSYTPIGDDFGFYVQTSATLDPQATREEWDIANFGVVQTNARKVRFNEVNTLLSWLWEETGYHVVSGVGMTTLNFSRSDFQATNATANFETSTGENLGLPNRTSITEDATNIVANLGIRYDSTFVEPDEETRLIMGFTVGLPVYYKVTNSNFPGVKWVDNFKGFDIQANVSYGFHVFENFLFSTTLEYLYKQRPETERLYVFTDKGEDKFGRVPEVTIWSARATAGLEWSF